MGWLQYIGIVVIGPFSFLAELVFRSRTEYGIIEWLEV